MLQHPRTAVAASKLHAIQIAAKQQQLARRVNFNGLPPGMNSGGDGSEVGRPAASHTLGATLRTPARQLEPSIGSEDHEHDVELRHVVKAAWDRWIGVLRDHGWGADAVLRPPAEVGAVKRGNGARRRAAAALRGQSPVRPQRRTRGAPQSV